MKKKILIGRLMCVLLFMSVMLTACGFGRDKKGDDDGGNIGNDGGNDIPTHTHTLVEQPYQESTTPCTGSGNYEYWECTGCGKYFYDSAGNDEYTNKSDVFFVAHHNLLTVERNEPTCTEPGNEAFWECLTCNACFRDGNATSPIEKDDVWIAALGHDYVSHAASTALCNKTGWNTYHTCSRCAYTTQVGFYAPHTYLSNTYICEDTCKTDLKITEGLAYTLNADEQSYTVSGIGTATDTAIVIPYTYNDKPVTAIGQQAFQNCKNITNVVIPSSVTSIGKYAFEDCDRIENIEIPSSVTSIGWCAFYGCASLQRVVIPSGVTSIEQYTFSGCGNLKCVEIPSTVTSIGRGAFEYCSSLVRIDFAGTKSQWEAVTKLDHWDSSREKKYLVYCSNAIFTAYGNNVASLDC